MLVDRIRRQDEVVEMIKYSTTKAQKPGERADPCYHTMLGGPHVDRPGLEVLVIDIIFN